jgi:branched-chain amino acid transport system ATP-binding protein
VQVPGGKAVFPSLSVEENLLIGVSTFYWDSERVTSRVEAVLELFPKLASRLDQPAGTLSGGEQQMLALAKAMLLDPRSSSSTSCHWVWRRSWCRSCSRSWTGSRSAA